MKHIFILSIVLLFGCSGWTQENNQLTDQRIRDLEARISNFEKHQKIFDSTNKTIDQKLTNRDLVYDQNLKFFYEQVQKERSIFFTVITLLFAITSAISVFIFYKSRKDLEERFKNIADELGNQIIEKKSKELMKDLSAGAFISAETYQKVIQAKAVEIELLRDYPIIIVEDTLNEEAISLQNQLLTYEFGSVSIRSKESLDNVPLLEKYVLIFFDNPETDFLTTLFKKYPKVGLFGFGNRRFDFSPNPICWGFSNSYSTVYNNLMSLLQYKRYLNSRA